jgi:glycine/D-amino acid oxidase-like deaminating enzyme
MAALHVRRAGWLSAQQLGMHLLDRARELGVSFRSGKVTGVEISNSQVQSVTLNSFEKILTGNFVNAAGPYFRNVGTLCGLEIPVKTELHLKVAFKDNLNAVDRDAPLLIWDDPQLLDWSLEDSVELRNDPDTMWLTEPFPSGAHTRPEGGAGSNTVLMLWEYQNKEMEPCANPPLDEYYPEVALRGVARMIPALRGYYGRAPRPLLDGGFYTKSRDNRPIVGPNSINGLFLIGALSGYGIMSACSVGELLAQHISGNKLAKYSNAFSLNRFDDPAHLAWMESMTDSGQL